MGACQQVCNFDQDDAVTSHPRPTVLTVDASDRPGLVALLASAIAEANGNIVDLGQHTDVDSSRFAARIEIAPGADLDRLEEQLSSQTAVASFTWSLHDPARRQRIVVACSRQLHCASDLLARIDLGELQGEVVGLVSDQLDGEALADRYGLPFSYVPVGDDREDQEQRFAAAVEELRPDLVVLARYMRSLPAWLTERYHHAMINVHHSFLPAFVGANPYRRAFERGVKMVGATAHYVTAELDAGPIIAQDVTPVTHADTVEDVVRRGADIERAVFIRAIRLHTEHRIQVFGNKTCVFD